MFQRLNQFLVLVTLLSAGIGGLAVPLRRQDLAVALVAQSGDQFCLDVSNGAPVFKGCDGGQGQAFNVEKPPGSDRSTSYIVASSGRCVTADSSSNVKLQDCSWENADPNQEWNVDVDNTAIKNVGTGNCLTQEIDGSVATAVCAGSDSSQSIATQLLSLSSH